MTPTTIEQVTTLRAAAKRPERSSRKMSEVTTQKKNQGVEYYTQLDYPVELVRDEDSYVASNPDLPGCISFGGSPNEAVESLKEVRDLWIKGQLKSGNPIPEPSAPERYSGKFVLRIPKMMHRIADSQARREGVSLNSYITSVLASALTYPTRSKESVSLDHERDKYWVRQMHGWKMGRVGSSWEVHGFSSEYGLYLNLVADTVGKPSVGRLEVPERGAHHHA